MIIIFAQTAGVDLTYPGSDVLVILGLEAVLVGLEDPAVTQLIWLQVENTVKICEIVSNWRCLIIVLIWDLLDVLLWLLDLVHHAVINGLICLLVGQSEPSSIELSLFDADLSSYVEFLDAEHNEGTWLTNSCKLDLDLPVVIDFQDWVPNSIDVAHAEFSALLVVWVDPGKFLALLIENYGLRVILGD